MEPKPLCPKEGLFVLHLFYRVDRRAWQDLSPQERTTARERAEELIADLRKQERTQLVTVALIARADLGFMVVGPELHALQIFEKRLAASLGAGVLQPVFTFFSLTEQSEYTSTDEDHIAELKARGLDPASPEFAQKMEVFRQRVAQYTQSRLYPTLPDWEFFAFYPMLKRRDPEQNWYSLDQNTRKILMLGHAAVGRTYSGRVQQLITGATGLDDWEWGVSLFAHDPYEVKSIVYEMRFDEVSAKYGGFGDFYTGLVLPVDELWKRLDLQ